MQPGPLILMNLAALPLHSIIKIFSPKSRLLPGPGNSMKCFRNALTFHTCFFSPGCLTIQIIFFYIYSAKSTSQLA